MEDIKIIQYKWENGIYQLKDMVELVRKHVITEKDFFYITRFNFYGIVKTYDL